jgi:hypothetical protein
LLCLCLSCARADHIRYYYWESVVLVEKLVLILPVMLLQRKGQGLQVLLAMLVITGASILQVGAGAGGVSLYGCGAVRMSA